MPTDSLLQGGVAALWALAGAARRGDAPLMQAAADVVVALLAAPTAELVLRDEGDRGIGLAVNGRPLSFGAGTFAAAHGLVELLRAHGVHELTFAPGIGAADLGAWAMAWARGGIGEGALPATVQATARGAGEPARSQAGTGAESRLGAVFVQHRLMTHVDPCSPVPPAIAKAVLQSIVDRLLAVPGGLEPLMLLQQDPELLGRSTNVAVLAVLFARVAGWPDAALPDLGVAALLHDVGARIDVDQPAQSGALWLLERGGDDLWLRAAIVARRWRATGDLAEAAAEPLPAVALVRVAERVEQARRAGDTDLLRRSLAAAVTAGEVPTEFAELALAALGADR